MTSQDIWSWRIWFAYTQLSPCPGLWNGISQHSGISSSWSWHKEWGRRCTLGQVGSDHVNAAELCCPGSPSKNLNAKLSSEKHPNMQMFSMMILELWTSQRHRTRLEKLPCDSAFHLHMWTQKHLKVKTHGKTPKPGFFRTQRAKI